MEKLTNERAQIEQAKESIINKLKEQGVENAENIANDIGNIDNQDILTNIILEDTDENVNKEFELLCQSMNEDQKKAFDKVDIYCKALVKHLMKGSEKPEPLRLFVHGVSI